MSDDAYSEMEAKLKAIKQARDIEMAIDRCKFGIINQGVVYKIAAETEYGTPHGGAERSVDAVFSIEDSARIFEFASGLLSEKLRSLRTELGL